MVSTLELRLLHFGGVVWKKQRKNGPKQMQGCNSSRKKEKSESFYLSLSDLFFPDFFFSFKQRDRSRKRSGKRQADRRVEMKSSPALRQPRPWARVGRRPSSSPPEQKPSQTFFLFHSKIPRPGRNPFSPKNPQTSTDRPEGPSRANPEPLSGLG